MIKFWRSVNKGDGCWEWLRGRGSHGYGQFYIDGKPQLTHRVAWKLTYGDIPSGMQVLHHCDNKLCVRPDHLFLGTQLDNMRDMCSKGRHSTVVPKGEDHVKAKLNTAAVADIRRRFIRGTRQHSGNALELAQQYGLTRHGIYAVANGKVWRHVT